jgi:Zn-dependent peptidase ImmA (M78 family)
MSKDIITYPSIFNPEISITLIFKENENYPSLKKVFDEYGFGFYSPKFKTIMIDGEVFVDNDDIDMNDLRFVEAHEISHLIMNHDGPRSDDNEIDADLGAYILLKNNGLDTTRLEEAFEERHGIQFSKDLFGRVEKYY